MKISRLYLENFRLFQKKLIKFSGSKVLISGKNACGKTSLLESVNILLSGKTFRGSGLAECVGKSKEHFSLALLGNERKNKIRIACKKSLTSRLSVSREMNSKPIKRKEIPFMSVVLGKKLNLVSGEAELRRDFLLKMMFHVKPAFKSNYSKYLKTLSQRNKLLKRGAKKQEVFVWSRGLAELGEEIIAEQSVFFEAYCNNLDQYFDGLEARHNISFLPFTTLKLHRGWVGSKKFSEALDESYEKDKALGYTTTGPHRSDIFFAVKRRKAEDVLSRGQQKLLILLLYLNIYPFFNNHFNLSSIFLIDDLSSELDSENLVLILKEILEAENQVFASLISLEGLGAGGSFLSNFDHINL